MKKITTALTLAGTMVWTAAAQNLVVNGGFEDPVLVPPNNYAVYVPGSTALTGWTIDASPGGGVQQFNTNIFRYTGSQNIQLTGGATYNEGGGVSQMISTVPGAFYIISLDINSRTATPATGHAKFGNTDFALTAAAAGFVSNMTFSAAAPGSSTLLDIISDDPQNATKLLIIDNVSVVQAVPGPVDPIASTVQAYQGAVAADGLSSSTVTVTLTDSNGIPVSGKTVTLAKASGPGTPVITTVSGTTSGGGEAVFKVTSTTPGVVQFAATDVTDSNLAITQTATVNFLAGSVANAEASTVVAAPSSVVADGVATSTVTVTLKDANNGPVSGKTVTLTNVSAGAAPIITTVSGTSDANGKATFTVASAKAGMAEFAAIDVTDAGIIVTNTATVIFTVGAVNAQTSTVTASPSVVPADNTSEATITVTLNDSTGNGVPNKNVVLNQVSGPGSPTITTVSGTTDTNGAALFTVSSITPGIDVFAATDVDDGNLVVTQTVAVTFSGLITWLGLATTVSGDSDVVTNGILVYAEHWAGVDSTVNGVPFTAAQNHVVGSSGGYETLTATNGYPQGSLSTAYWNILRGKWYNAGSSQTVTLNALQAGHQYLLQIWSSDPRYSSTQSEIILPGFALGIQAGQYGVGTFTALGSTQVLGLSGDGVLNAVQVRDLSIIALNLGPSAGQLTIQGYTDQAGSIVTWKATSLASLIVWTPIQTNAVPGGNYSFAVPKSDAAAYFRTQYLSQ